MVKALFLLLFTIFSIEAKDWDKKLFFSLKKDEVKTYLFKNGEKNFKLNFFWTLYKDGALITKIEYNEDRYSPVLLNSFGHNSFKIKLFTKRKDSRVDVLQTPYLLIVFKDFDEIGKKAFFNLNIKDYGISEVYNGKEGKR